MGPYDTSVARKRNAQDATLLNIRALQKRVAALEAKEKKASVRYARDRADWLDAMRQFRQGVASVSAAVQDMRDAAQRLRGIGK